MLRIHSDVLDWVEAVTPLIRQISQHNPESRRSARSGQRCRRVESQRRHVRARATAGCGLRHCCAGDGRKRDGARCCGASPLYRAACAAAARVVAQGARHLGEARIPAPGVSALWRVAVLRAARFTSTPLLAAATANLPRSG